MGGIDADRGGIPPIDASAAALVAELAEGQYGVVTRRQLLDLGIPSRTITDWVRNGHLHRIHRGVYAVGHTRIGMDGHRLAAVLFAGLGSFLSHWSSADLTGIISVDERSVSTSAGRPGRGPTHRESSSTARPASSRST
jgi:hypothetical protein